MEDGRRSRAPRVRRTPNVAPDIALPWPLMRSACIVNMLGQFWEVYLPSGKQLDIQLGHHSTWGVVDFMGLLSSQDDVLRKAAAAMCLATVDVREDEQWLRETSLRYYTEALHEMAAALYQPRNDGGLALVGAIRIFSIYEVRNSTSISLLLPGDC
jgi:hypothetical protein